MFGWFIGSGSRVIISPAVKFLFGISQRRQNGYAPREFL
jgi:hypothetical protein